MDIAKDIMHVHFFWYARNAISCFQSQKCYSSQMRLISFTFSSIGNSPFTQ